MYHDPIPKDTTERCTGDLVIPPSTALEMWFPCHLWNTQQAQVGWTVFFLKYGIFKPQIEAEWYSQYCVNLKIYEETTKRNWKPKDIGTKKNKTTYTTLKGIKTGKTWENLGMAFPRSRLQRVQIMGISALKSKYERNGCWVPSWALDTWILPSLPHIIYAIFFKEAFCSQGRHCASTAAE